MIHRHEEQLNVVSHGIAFLVTVLGIATHIATRFSIYDRHSLGSLIFGVGLAAVYLGSTYFHWKLLGGNMREILAARRLDMLAIFVLIAATYTGVMLCYPAIGIQIWALCILWGTTLVGAYLLYKYPTINEWTPTAMYLAMGWLGPFVIGVGNLFDPDFGGPMIFWGGVTYTCGVIPLALQERIKYMHFIWHLYVLLASYYHYVALPFGIPQEVFK